MPKDLGKGKDGEPTELVAVQPAEVTVRGDTPIAALAPEQGELVVVGEEKLSYGDPLQWEVVKRLDQGSLALATLPHWDILKRGDLTYEHFAFLLAEHFGIGVRCQLEGWFSARLTSERASDNTYERNGQDYCRTLFMLYILREKTAGIATEVPLGKENPPLPPVSSKSVSGFDGDGCLLWAAGFAAVLAVACGGVVVIKKIVAPEDTVTRTVAAEPSAPPEPAPIPYVPLRSTGMTMINDLDAPVLTKADYDFLEGCGSEGYVLVQCTDGVPYQPPVVHIKNADNVPEREQDKICWYHDGGYQNGACGESFVETTDESREFDWLEKKNGTVKDEFNDSEKLAYRPLYPNPFAACTLADGVLLWPIVPIGQTDVAESCIARPIRPMKQ